MKAKGPLPLAFKENLCFYKLIEVQKSAVCQLLILKYLVSRLTRFPAFLFYEI
jgi:hypothetical protein